MKTYSIAVLLFASSLLAACGEDEPAPQPAQPAQPATITPQAARPADPTAKMARAYVSGKQSAPVDLKYDVMSKPELGKVVEIDLAFIPTAVTDSMTVSVASGTPGLEIVSGASGIFGILQINEVAHHKLTVRADRADVVYFTVTAAIQAVGINSARTFSIPLIVSDPAATAPATANVTTEAQAKPDATGQKIESMRAEERK